MLRFIATTLFAALIAAPAVAAPPAPVSLTRDGQHYLYTSELKGQLIAISGKQLDNGDRIDLIVDPAGEVSGTVGFMPVSFSIPKERRDRIVASLAAATSDQVAAIR